MQRDRGPAPLDATALAELADRLRGLRIGSRIVVVETTRSTSDDVRELAAAGHPEGAVVLAEAQTAGRGRRGNVWVAPRGRCLLLSILLRPPGETAWWPRITHIASVAVCQALETVLPVSAGIKWPNDVFVRGRKICGILLESAPAAGGGYVVLGLGINVHLQTEDFPAELRQTATSLEIESAGAKIGKIGTGSLRVGVEIGAEMGPEMGTGPSTAGAGARSGPAAPLSREEVLGHFLGAFNRLYPDALEHFDPLRAELHRRSVLLGRRVCVTAYGQEHRGRVTGFGPSGELLLESPGGDVRTIASGDSVRVLP